ncbi:MAG TPA: MBL fold metallo-hydrolase [Cytophagaceae bacterium]|nr:MBL fold metallo-hydrolase [Cytophagaceae bacterium]
MTITFLGTGTSQGVPVIGCTCEVCRSVDFRDKRLRSSIHLEVDGKSFIIDSGPDFRQQVLRERITKLDALIFTHEHKDHTAGMDDIRSYNFFQQKNMPIYGTKKVLDQIKKEFSYAFAEFKYPGVPLIDPIEIENKPFGIEGVRFSPIEVMHFKLPVFGYRVNDFTYITDANSISDQEIKKIKGSKVIVLNALQKTEHISHFTFDEAVELLKKLKPEKAFLIHLSHRMGLHKEVEKELPDFIRIAYDGLKVHLE